ncbi:hypothetical protein CPB84DRAFT_916735 [Gymnopilus junonius]|uniref:Uncharacterized protein n=1 Tax=Gymnopilus junonius TaxID=109634 RepID=A0A9P5P1B5_GYMJU|nr:hypothetical protein CPB84DRAFT_916735 [Gymnopilus junonius]
MSADWAAEIEIEIIEVEEGAVDQLRVEYGETRYLFPSEVVEPETASEYTVDEEVDFEEVILSAEVEDEVDMYIPVSAASIPPKEPEAEAEPEPDVIPEQETAALTSAPAADVEEEIRDERVIVDEDEDDFDDMYMDEELVVERPAGEGVTTVAEDRGS